jgi:hypothetical protein
VWLSCALSSPRLEFDLEVQIAALLREFCQAETEIFVGGVASDLCRPCLGEHRMAVELNVEGCVEIERLALKRLESAKYF